MYSAVQIFLMYIELAILISTSIQRKLILSSTIMTYTPIIDLNLSRRGSRGGGQVVDDSPFLKKGGSRVTLDPPFLETNLKVFCNSYFPADT